MAKKILQIIASGYRVTIEEQDDPAIWITHAMQGAQGSFAVLLQGAAVNYGVKAQDASGLAIGGWKQTQPPRLADDVQALVTKGMDVYVVAEDLAERGLAEEKLVSGLKPVSRVQIPDLLPKFDQVWRW